MNGSDKLRQFALKYCHKTIVKISDRIIYFGNYGPSSAAAVIGDTSVILIDTLRSRRLATMLREDLKQFTDKPVRTVIYTSSIKEMTGGSCVFEDVDQVYGAVGQHAGLKYLDKVEDIKQMRKIWTRGYGLSDKLIVPGKDNGQEQYDMLSACCAHPLEVTTYVEKDMDLVIDGVHLKLMPAPSETFDSLLVWLPEEETVCTGVVFYGAFPNLDVTTGSAYFNVGEWIDSLKRVRSCNARVILPGMTLPVEGREVIREMLDTEIDCFQYLVDTALNMINDGLTIEEMLAQFSLPDRFKVWYLTPFYGRPEWMLRCLYDRYMGWFDGLAAHLSPVPESEYKGVLRELIGDEALKAKICELMDQEKYQLALQLCELGDFRDLKKQALGLLAESSDNLNERYYFYSRYQDL